MGIRGNMNYRHQPYWRIVKDDLGKPSVICLGYFDDEEEAQFLTEKRFDREHDAYLWIALNASDGTLSLQKEVEDLKKRISKLEKLTKGL